tara:strand:+ start:212 stop:886 length:675 start_codon:yes stop_codon:yes gene_type:complete
MKIKNYTIFDKNDSKNWNKLRDSEALTNYFTPSSRDEYILKLKGYKINPEVENDLEYIIKKKSINKVFSLCSGSCELEYYIMNKFGLKCYVSDTTNSMKRIKDFNIFKQASIIDITKPFKLKIDENSLLLLSRIDTEFEDYQLENIFDNLNSLGAQIIYFIPAEILTIKSFLVNIKLIFACFLKFKKPVSWGYIRSYYSFEKLWKKNYTSNSKNNFGLTLKKND